MRALLGLVLVLLAACDGGARAEGAGRPRLVTVGGAVTEAVFALGAGADVVGVDTSSVWPADVARLPKVGYQRQLAAEGVLSLRPTLVLAAREAGPPAAIAQLREAGVRVVLVGAPDSPAGAREKVRQVAAALDRVAAGERLVEAMAREAAEADALVRRATSRPRALLVYTRGGGTASVFGAGTAADTMLRLAGADNAVGAFDGPRPLTAEAVAAAAPDVIVVPARGLDSAGGALAILRLPGVALTPAGRDRRVVAVDDLLLLGFGPRVATGVRTLALALHPELAGSQP